MSVAGRGNGRDERGVMIRGVACVMVASLQKKISNGGGHRRTENQNPEIARKPRVDVLLDQADMETSLEALGTTWSARVLEARL